MWGFCFSSLDEEHRKHVCLYFGNQWFGIWRNGQSRAWKKLEGAREAAPADFTCQLGHPGSCRVSPSKAHRSP